MRFPNHASLPWTVTVDRGGHAHSYRTGFPEHDNVTTAAMTTGTTTSTTMTPNQTVGEAEG